MHFDAARAFGVIVLGEAEGDGEHNDDAEDGEGAVRDVDAELPPLRAEQAGHEILVLAKGKVRQQHGRASRHDQRKSEGEAVSDGLEVLIPEESLDGLLQALERDSENGFSWGTPEYVRRWHK